MLRQNDCQSWASFFGSFDKPEASRTPASNLDSCQPRKTSTESFRFWPRWRSKRDRISRSAFIHSSDCARHFAWSRSSRPDASLPNPQPAAAAAKAARTRRRSLESVASVRAGDLVKASA